MGDLERRLLASLATSYWLKAAIEATAKRDPVDAARDVDLLRQVCEARLKR